MRKASQKPRINRFSARTWGLVCLAAAVAAATDARAQRQRVATESEDVGVEQKLNAQIPLDLEFTDSTGKRVKLADFFDGTRPVLLTMNYSDCPKLCHLQLTALVQGMSKMTWDIGDKFQVVTVSIDPSEPPEKARKTKDKYLMMYGRDAGGDGWHFLVGEERNIKQLADAVGFAYKWVEQSQQFSHAAPLMICTPDGRVARYLASFENYDPQTLKYSLVEAADGKIGSLTDQFFLYCFHYDPESGSYSWAAFRVMQIGAVLTLVVVGGVLALFWRREVHKKRKQDAGDDSGSPRTDDAADAPRSEDPA